MPWFLRGLLLCCLLAPTVAAADPQRWVLDPERSRIGIAFEQLGTTVEGAFTAFEADIRFEPGTPAGDIAVTIDTGSLATGDAARDRDARGPVFFDVEAHPTATFRAREIAAGDRPGRFRAVGTLAIKGIERPAVLPFALAIEDGVATADGTLTVSRGDYGIGTGDRDVNMVLGDEVSVTVRVVARRRE